MPLLLCVAEQRAPGRIDGLDDELLLEIQQELGRRFAPQSASLPHGRVGVAVALAQARNADRRGQAAARADRGHRQPAHAGPRSAHYERDDRLLTAQQLQRLHAWRRRAAPCSSAPAGSGRRTGLHRHRLRHREGAHRFRRAVACRRPTQAIKAALADAGCEMHDLDFRITDISGEQYYFKEAALALVAHAAPAQGGVRHLAPGRMHGEAGARLASRSSPLADAACRKGYTPGPEHSCSHWPTTPASAPPLSLHYGRD